MTPLLVEAVNELHNQLQSTLATHRQEMANLNKDNDALRERLSNLESIVLELATKEK